MSLRWRSAAERKMPRLMRSRSILLNQLDLVEPGGVGGSEVQADVGVKLQELLHSLCLVGREVVQDDVDLLARRLLGDYRSQEGDELLGGMPGSSPPDHLAGLGVERGVQGEGASADVLEAVALEAPGRQRQDGIAAIEGLNGGLLVQAEYDGVLWGVEVKADDVGRLGLEVRVVGSHIALEAMWLETGPLPDPGHPHVRYIQVPSQLSAAPVGAPVGRRPAGGTQDLGLEFVDVRSWLPALVAGVEALQSLSQERL